ncbi:MAG: hypothetical protein ING84_07345 [Cytophagales bacterium]|jgi:hypothetical protein|nr:hypothetical protein [Cytophagales bacterium]MCA6369013.1 hypothetical protein [Cytophagales bacterium]MCA6371477.1 hypothetical protein [Cytophagales bacterium]MCA6377836.1 hypothetical protein [Cytophagales bacterium]MCA6385276.1 hypothetical protein [Cytophagales bacterium]
MTKFILFFLLTSFAVYAQDSTQFKALKNDLDEIKKLLQDDKDEKDTIGIFTVHKFDEIQVYNEKETVVEKISISEVTFDIKDGVIIDLQVVTTDHRIFTNLSAPIALSRFHRCDILGYYNGNETVYIRSCDFISWKRHNTFIPDDQHFRLTKKNSSKILFRGAGLNQISDVRFYSDLLGTLGNEANGIAQTEGSTRIFINNLNFKNTGLIFFRYGGISFQASKLDSKFSTTKNDSNLTNLKFLQRNWLNIDLTANIFSVWLQNKSRSWASLNAGAGATLTRLAEKSDTLSRTGNYYFLEVLGEFKEISNFGIDFSTRFFWLTVPGVGGNFGKLNPLIKVSTNIYWSPLANTRNRVFLRVNYFQDLVEKGEPFFQFQVGYSVVLSSLLKEGQK